MNRENFGIFKTVIVGAGASGLALATVLGEKFGGENIALIERLDRVGKKLLSTGNGQCNLTNKSCGISHFHSQTSNFCNEIISVYGAKAVIDFFENLGIPTTVDGDKVYPLSKQASSVVDALRFKISALKVKTILGEKVIDVSAQNSVFSIRFESGKTIRAESVVIAVGGSAQKHLGTDGSSYNLLEKFGHKRTKLYPSIVQLKADVKKLKGLKGLKQKVSATAIVGGQKVADTSGDIMFTDYGLSGNVAFYLSSYFAGCKDTAIEIDFCPELSVDELSYLLKKKQKNCSYLTVEYLLQGIMNGKISQAILKNSGYDLTMPIASAQINSICKAVKNYQIEVVGTLGFDGAQVTKGGIMAQGFNCKTLESNYQKNLYATGEVLDVDGDCGGYNLTWAFSSAFAVADAIK